MIQTKNRAQYQLICEKRAFCYSYSEKIPKKFISFYTQNLTTAERLFVHFIETYFIHSDNLLFTYFLKDE
ncbi:hypothetical protein BML2537_04390 [Providencia stuartii]|nr:hypothetical protein BML2537_04390 [Providencia stuartii]GHB98842.1 hypothetical protein GCM10007290_28490 [Providencia thailandensis]